MHQKDNKIEMFRGQNHSIIITPHINGEAYTLEENDKIIFSVRTHAAADSKKNPVLIKKMLTGADYIEGKLYLRFTPEDTVNLYGSYKYDCVIEINRQSYMLIEPSDFFVKSTVSESEALPQ